MISGPSFKNMYPSQSLFVWQSSEPTHPSQRIWPSIECLYGKLLYIISQTLSGSRYLSWQMVYYKLIIKIREINVPCLFLIGTIFYFRINIYIWLRFAYFASLIFWHIIFREKRPSTVLAPIRSYLDNLILHTSQYHMYAKIARPWNILWSASVNHRIWIWDGKQICMSSTTMTWWVSFPKPDRSHIEATLALCAGMIVTVWRHGARNAWFGC